MSVYKTASKHEKIDSYGNLKSPRNNYGSQQTVVQRDTQTRLLQKIQKLKAALKATEKHNEQLHRKLKIYKHESHDKIPFLQEQIKVQRKKMEMIQIEHKEQINRISQINLKQSQQMRALSAGKISNSGETQKKIRNLDIQIKSKDMKIVQLEGVIKDLNLSITTKEKQIKDLYKQIEQNKLQKLESQQKKMNKIQDQMQLKVAESHEYNRQIIRLKQSLKDSLKKNEKSNTQLFEQTEKNKQLAEQLKESRKLVDKLQKQSAFLRQSSDKLKLECLQHLNKSRSLEKDLLQSQYNLKHEKQKYQNLSEAHNKLQEQFKSLLQQFKILTQKNQQILTSQYDLHRDFQRELHTIVKQLTRRHIVSKNLTSAATSPKGNYNPEGEGRVDYKI